MGGKSNPLMAIGLLAAGAAAIYFTGGAATPGVVEAEAGAAMGAAGAAGATTAATTGSVAAGGALAGGAAGAEGLTLATLEGGALAGGEGLTYTTAVEGGGLAMGETAMSSQASLGFTGALDNGLLTTVADTGVAAAPETAAVPEAFANVEYSDAFIQPPEAPFSFGNIIGNAKSGAALTYGEAAGLGMAGIGGLARASQTQATARSQQDMLDAQMGQARIASEDRELQSQQRLAQTLAAQTVGFYARGQQTGSGSARALAESASTAADMDSGLASAGGVANEWSYAAQSSALTRQRNTSWMGGLFDVAGEGANVWRRRSMIGSV